MRVPETPPEQPPFGCHAWAGFSRERKFNPAPFGTFAFTPALPFHRTHLSHLFKGGNDETRSHHNRHCGDFGSDHLGVGGECTI